MTWSGWAFGLVAAALAAFNAILAAIVAAITVVILLRWLAGRR